MKVNGTTRSSSLAPLSPAHDPTVYGNITGLAAGTCADTDTITISAPGIMNSALKGL